LGAEGPHPRAEGGGLVDQAGHREPVGGSLGLHAGVDTGSGAGDEPGDAGTHEPTQPRPPAGRGSLVARAAARAARVRARFRARYARRMRPTIRSRLSGRSAWARPAARMLSRTAGRVIEAATTWSCVGCTITRP